ncbi:hypothetical protein BH23GEM6_BH23GEM6_11090 [soil metagenome]
MSDSAAAFFEADPAVAAEIAERLFVAGRVEELGTRLLNELTSDSTWAREQALERLCALLNYEPLLPHLASSLAAHDDAERRNAARSALAALTAPTAKSPAAALRLLRTLLQTPDDPDIRLLAASALGESGNAAAREALEAALNDPEANVVSAAADALGILGDPRAVPALSQIAEAGSFWTRAAALVALGQLRDPAAIPTVARALAEPTLTSTAASALGAIGQMAGLEPMRAILESHGRGHGEALRSAAAIFANGSSDDVPGWLREAVRGMEAELEQRLAADDDVEAGRLLGLSGSQLAADALVRSLGIPGREDAVAAGLSLLPDEVRSDAILERLADDPGEGSRALLLLSLPPLESASALEIVTRQLADPDTEVRAAAAEVLGRSDEELVLPALQKAIADPAAHHGVALAYARLGGSSCQPLVALLRSPSSSVRAAAAEGLARCGNTYVDDLREAIRSEVDAYAKHVLVRSLGASRTVDAVEELIRLLDDRDPGLRFAAVQALGRTRLDAAFEPLIAALADKQPEVRAVALASLGEIGDPRAGKPLADHLSVPDRDLRRTAIFALDRIDRPQVLRELLQALRDSDREVRLTAIRVLHRLGTEEGRKALQQVADMDPEVLVRQAASRALSDSQPASPGESS